LAWDEDCRLVETLKPNNVPLPRAALFARMGGQHSLCAQACSTSSLTGHLYRPASHGQVGQISPDNNMNCGYTTAAFTLSPEPWASLCCAHSAGSGHPEQSRRVPTCPETGPCMPFLFPGSGPGEALARSFALRLPSDTASRWRPLGPP